jgi:hypothetical protein
MQLYKKPFVVLHPSHVEEAEQQPAYQLFDIACTKIAIMQFKSLRQGMPIAFCLLSSALCQGGNSSMPVFTPELNSMRTLSVGFVSLS